MRSIISQLPYRTTFMAGLGLIVGVVIVFTFFFWQTFSQVTVSGGSTAISATSSAQLVDNGPQPINILLLGYGGGGHEGGKLTDTIIVARIDPKHEQITLISLPRDIWVSFPVNGATESSWKINAAYQIGSDDRGYPQKLDLYSGEAGGGNLAKYAASKVVGFPIDHFVAVSFAGFTKSIDVLNGVDVRVERTFDDYWYPIEGKEDETCGKTDEDIAAVTATLSGYLLEQEFPCRYEHLHFDQGLVHMDGASALKYARSRHSLQDGSDFARSQRQKNVILATKDKILQANFLPKIIPFVTTLRQEVRTDLSLEAMQSLLQKAGEYSSYDIKSIALTDDNVLQHSRSQDGQYILIPQAGEGNWTSIHDWLLQEMQRENVSQASPAAASN